MIITCDQLAQNLGQPNLRIVDIRGAVGHQDLGDGFEKGIYTADHEAYAASHIPGAVFVDWTLDIVDPTQTVKAQVANPEQFAQAMGQLRIGPDSFVVIYDQGMAQFATRLWWCLQYYGHRQCAVLDGGWAAWSRGDYPVDAETPAYAPVTFIPIIQPDWRIEPGELVALLNQPTTRIVDARPAAHFRGERTRAQRKGHIPQAVNLPRPDLITPAGFKSLDTWREQFASLGIEPEDTVVAYCNGGVAASTILFALHELGYSKLRLYDGSWNEWGNRSELPTE